MSDGDLGQVEKLLASLNKLLEILANHPNLVTVVVIVISAIFIYATARVLLDFFGRYRVDKALESNNKMLGKVEKALDYLNSNFGIKNVQ